MSNIPSEFTEQAAVVTWLRRRGVNFFAVPNGAKVGRRQGAKLKKEGLTPGVADLIIIDPPPALGGVLVVALEMKRREGGRLSPAQRRWKDIVTGKPGWYYAVGRGAQDAINQLRRLGYG